MTALVPMRPEQFAPFVEEAIAAYARDNAAAGRWPSDEALARSRAEFDRLLPQGFATPNHFIYEIQDDAGGTTVGFLWFAVVGETGTRSGYVYNVQVKPEFRRRGHARAAFAALERIAAEAGLANIGLHVFGHNPGAQALYASLGYRVTGINMLKPLRPAAQRSRSTS
jgi:ribosomal protein S18 acetylase RimI-like enzyme